VSARSWRITTRAYYATYYAIDAINFEPVQSPAVMDAIDGAYLPLVIQEAAGIPLDPSFEEQKSIMLRCKGVFLCCKDGAESAALQQAADRRRFRKKPLAARGGQNTSLRRTWNKPDRRRSIARRPVLCGCWPGRHVASCGVGCPARHGTRTFCDHAVLLTWVFCRIVFSCSCCRGPACPRRLR